MSDNQWGWPLPTTDRMLFDEMPYYPLTEASHNVAERLVMLGHLTFNEQVWSPRITDYWDAYKVRIESAANTIDMASWWCTLTDDMNAVPLRESGLLHEKNLLVHPSQLAPPVLDDDILATLRRYARDLIDRTRMWVRMRHNHRSGATDDQ